MVKFALRLLLFAGILFIYDKVFILVSNRSADTEIDKRLEYLVNGDINKDIIITGSSTGSRDIIAKLIEDEIDLSTYNLCYPGSTVEFHEFILRTLVKFNKPPKILLLVVDDNAELIFDVTITFRKDRLYPLVKYQYIWEELAKHANKEIFISRFLVLNRLNKYNFDLRQKSFTALDTIMDCGSMPISWKRKGINLDYDSGERIYPIDKELPEKVTAYKEIIKTCKANNINLVVVFPPVFKSHSKTFEKRIRELSGDEAYFYLYNTKNPIYSNKDYYYDKTHLMREGAITFTNELIKFLKDLIENDIKIHNDPKSDIQSYEVSGKESLQ